ncbi:MAG: hypothetical protein MJY72_05900 [Bacteroidales bacterium]|nr:hypothetical protein [Bacteroidales bacterium]
MSASVYAQNEKVVTSDENRQETVLEDDFTAMSDPAVLSDKVLEKDVMEADNFEARRQPLPDIEISRMRDSSLSRPSFAEKIQITNTEAFIPSPGLKPVPFIRNYYGSGTVWSHGNFGIIGSSSYHEHPFLLTSREAELAAGMNFGKLGIVAGVSATNYAGMYIPNMYQLGVGGQIAYGITENIGIVAYGQFYDKVPYVTMSAYPFVNTSHYGGYISIAGDVVGINLGAERYFDPMSRSWETLPIITPTIRIGDNATIGIPIGGLVRGLTSEIRMRNMPPPPSKAAPHPAPANTPRHLHR